MELPLLAIVLCLYLIGAASFVTHLMVLRELPRRIGSGVLFVAFALHAVALAARSAALGWVAFNSFHAQLSFLAWLIVGVYLLLELRYHLAVMGALVCPLAFLLTFSAYLVYSGVQKFPENLHTAQLFAHVAPSFLGYAVFAVACCISLMYLVQEKQLKGKRRASGRLRGLPSLETLDALNYRFVTWGFALFTIGIITGSLLAKAEWGEFWSWEPVQVLSVLTWLTYAGLLHTRSVGWRGRRAATLTIVGFALLAASFLGVNLLFPGRHNGTVG